MTNIDNAKLIEVILVSAVAGDGTKENPTRCVQELWTKDGKLICCLDASVGTESQELRLR